MEPIHPFVHKLLHTQHEKFKTKELRDETFYSIAEFYRQQIDLASFVPSINIMVRGKKYKVESCACFVTSAEILGLHFQCVRDEVIQKHMHYFIRMVQC